jgi:hypothetical protein
VSTEPLQLAESERHWNREAAKEEIENLKNVRATAWDEHTHSFRWIMATLSAINGGACVAILNQDGMNISSKLLASGLFVGGLLMALLVAVFGQHSVQRCLLPLQRQIGYWMTVASDGERDEAFETELNEELKTSARIGMGGRVSGWLAAICFISGVVVAGFGLSATEHALTKQVVKQNLTARSPHD